MFVIRLFCVPWAMIHGCTEKLIQCNATSLLLKVVALLIVLFITEF